MFGYIGRFACWFWVTDINCHIWEDIGCNGLYETVHPPLTVRTENVHLDMNMTISIQNRAHFVETDMMNSILSFCSSIFQCYAEHLFHTKFDTATV